MDKAVLTSRVNNCIIALNNAKNQVELLAKDSDSSSLQTLFANMSLNLENMITKLDITGDEIKLQEL